MTRLCNPIDAELLFRPFIERNVFDNIDKELAIQQLYNMKLRKRQNNLTHKIILKKRRLQSTLGD
jgi:hypothetical protein